MVIGLQSKVKVGEWHRTGISCKYNLLHYLCTMSIINTPAFHQITAQLNVKKCRLVAVSKTKPIQAVQALYDLGQRDFGENYVQELIEKQVALPNDIRWHFIGHLQTNKVKQIASFVHLIHGVDSEKLLDEINKQAAKCNRIIAVLLQVHIATEETKFGLDAEEVHCLVSKRSNYPNVQICGLMGMASNTADNEQIKNEFDSLYKVYQNTNQQFSDQPFHILSMGMSSDYQMAIEEGSSMVRVGSSVFGER